MFFNSISWALYIILSVPPYFEKRFDAPIYMISHLLNNNIRESCIILARLKTWKRDLAILGRETLIWWSDALILYPPFQHFVCLFPNFKIKRNTSPSGSFELYTTCHYAIRNLPCSKTSKFQKSEKQTHHGTYLTRNHLLRCECCFVFFRWVVWPNVNYHIGHLLICWILCSFSCSVSRSTFAPGVHRFRESTLWYNTIIILYKL